MSTTNQIVETYSRLAKQYDEEANASSCWGRAAEKALASIRLKKDYGVALDVGCGTGKALVRLASDAPPGVRFKGIDPAENMRVIATQRTRDLANVEILDGSFESMPLKPRSVDYLYSIFAFHWTTDPEGAVREIARVVKPSATMDLFFIGRHNGREFIQKTTPIFLKYMGPALLLNSTRMRKQLTKDVAFELFGRTLGANRISVEESYTTYYDSLEGHMGWWVRIEGHFVRISPEKKQACDREVREALSTLACAEGIPYTIHQLHVRLLSVSNEGVCEI
jgi:ubiquinone/menaquinone biosynthesis C-methylase UbiE